VKRIIDLGYPSDQMLNSVTFTGLQTADDMIRTIQYFQREFGIKTSLNVYHSYLRPGTPLGELKRFIPEEDEVRKVYDFYALQWDKKELPMNCVNKQYCSSTLAVLCDGSITPCATIRGESVGNLHRGDSLYDSALAHKDLLTIGLLRERKNLPSGCSTCRLSDRCFGCRSRAYAAGRGIYGKDPGCFRTNIFSMRNK
jgi:radical SAM protein with 4Fe4S-binding SPASM domain